MLRSYTEQQLTKTKDRDIAYYVMTIEIVHVGINDHDFGLIIKKDKYSQTNCNEKNITMTVSQIYLEDLVKYHDIMFKVKHGYIWGRKCSRSHANQEVIHNLYNLRAECKRQGSSLETVLKLMLNSAYGKQLQKPIKNITKVFYNKDKYIKYRISHDTQIDSIIPIYNYLTEDSEYGWLVKERKCIDDQYNNAVFAGIILDFSKRIMNEVMCLAKELGIRIYYQDTDSIHLEADKLDLLCDEFHKKYGRELIGSDVGQFHPDFDELSGDNIHTVCSIFNSKKCYYDLIVDDNHKAAVHFRAKGIPQDALKNYCKDMNISILEAYLKVFNGEKVNIDIVKYCPSFATEKSGRIMDNYQFSRTIQSTYELGRDSLEKISKDELNNYKLMEKFGVDVRSLYNLCKNKIEHVIA
jgi:hypothetical protein